MNVDIVVMHRALEALLDANGVTVTMTIGEIPISLREFHAAVEARLDELTQLCVQGFRHEQRLDAACTQLRAELQDAQTTVRARRKKIKTIELRRDVSGAVASYEVFESV